VARWLLMDFYWAWWWLVGEAWAGKTALLAEAVTTLPGDVDNGDAERDACGRARTAGEVVLAELDQDGERDTYRGGLMPVSRLVHIPGIGVDEIGDAADATGNPDFLRLENLDTDVPPPALAREITHAAVEDDDANSYLPWPPCCVIPAPAPTWRRPRQSGNNGASTSSSSSRVIPASARMAGGRFSSTAPAWAFPARKRRNVSSPGPRSQRRR